MVRAQTTAITTGQLPVYTRHLRLHAHGYLNQIQPGGTASQGCRVGLVSPYATPTV